jgi:hypothetical protein
MAPSLDDLPSDIQYLTFSYLSKALAGYALDGVPRTSDLYHRLSSLQPTVPQLLKTHPFQNLAGTCKQLRVAVEGYCRHLLDRHKDILGTRRVPEIGDQSWEEFAVKNASRKNTKVRRETYRNTWIRAAHEKCVWCGKRSKRKAVFDMLVYCCHPCDQRAYGKRLSKSQVIARYRLKPLLWLWPNLVFPNTGLRPLKVARRSVCGGTEATYLLESEAMALAAYIKEHDPQKRAVREAAVRYGHEGQYIAEELMMEDMFWQNKLFWPVAEEMVSQALELFLDSLPTDMELKSFEDQMSSPIRTFDFSWPITFDAETEAQEPTTQ